jgi:hypothetical protein
MTQELASAPSSSVEPSPYSTASLVQMPMQVLPPSLSAVTLAWHGVAWESQQWLTLNNKLTQWQVCEPTRCMDSNVRARPSVQQGVRI